MIDDTRLYIDGAWTDRPDAPRIAVTNPATEEVIGHIAAGSGPGERVATTTPATASSAPSAVPTARGITSQGGATLPDRFTANVKLKP